MDTFNNFEDIPEPYVEVLMSLFVCWRGLVALLNPCETEFAAEAQSLLSITRAEKIQLPQWSARWRSCCTTSQAIE